jgi:hypothetical protein
MGKTMYDEGGSGEVSDGNEERLFLMEMRKGCWELKDRTSLV